MDITPLMNCATERKMEIMFMAKPVWAKRELNYTYVISYVPQDQEKLVRGGKENNLP
jgi:hypothetical protein